ncbi:prefoldin subunit alpha [Candidatus Woesearchaeota archaeon]|nr:prefoldin subunit alpha [Candidatus Woesearchaeota archaeon]
MAEEKNDDNEQMQSKYYEFQLINEQLKELQQQAQVLEEQLGELQSTVEALGELKKTKKGEKLLVPVSQGIFAKAELKNNEKLVVNVGANTLVDKGVDETKELINERLKRVTEFKDQTMHNIEALSARAKELLEELQSMVGEEE